MPDDDNDDIYAPLVGKVCAFQLHASAFMMMICGADAKTPGVLHRVADMRRTENDAPNIQAVPQLAPVINAKLTAANKAHFLVEYADMANTGRTVMTLLRRDLVLYVTAVGEERLIKIATEAAVLPIPPSMQMTQRPEGM